MADWIDPFNMNLNTIHSNDVTTNGELSSCNESENYVTSFYKRLIHMLLNSVDLDDGDSPTYRGYINVNMPVKDFQFLSEFVKRSEVDKRSFEQIDGILQNIYRKSTSEKISQFMLSWTEFLQLTITFRSISIFLGCIFVMLICMKLYRAKVTIWSTVKYLIFIAWIVDFGFTWMNLYQKAEVDKMVDALKLKAAPENCDPSKTSFLRNVWEFLSGSDECKQYHQAMFNDIFWSVSPFAVISAQFKTPALNIGNSIGQLVSGILGSLPWGVNVVLLPIILLFLCIISCLIISFVTETSFKINLAHLISFDFSNADRRAIGDVLNGQNLQRLLENMTHREAIQEVHHYHMHQSKNVTQLSSSIENASEPSELIAIDNGGNLEGENEKDKFSNKDNKSENEICDNATIGEARFEGIKKNEICDKTERDVNTGVEDLNNLEHNSNK